jgi:hypothetical protein
VGDWGESFRAITGLDERRLVTWLAQTTERSWGLARGGAQDLAQSIVVAGRSVGEVLVVRAEQAGDVVADASRGVVQGFGTAAGAMVDLGKRAGTGEKTRSALAEFRGRLLEGLRSVQGRVSEPFKTFRRQKSKDESEGGAHTVSTNAPSDLSG